MYLKETNITIYCLSNTSVGPLHCKGEGGREESVRSFEDQQVMVVGVHLQ